MSDNYIFLGLAWICRDSLVMEVSCVCTFCQAMESMMHFQIETPNVNLNQNFRGLPRMLCLQRWSFCNFAFMGSEHVGHSWKRYFLRRCHLEAKMTKGRSGGYTCKSLRGHTGKTCVSLSVESPLRGFVCHFYIWHVLSNRQGGGVGVPAGEFSSASSPLEHQRHSLQRLYGWYSPSMEHPKCQCNALSQRILYSQYDHL